MSNILQNLKTAEFAVLTSDRDTLASIAEKYDKLMESNRSNGDLSVIHNNNDCYSVLLNEALVKAVVTSYGGSNITSYNAIKTLCTNNGITSDNAIIDRYYKELCKSFTKHGYNVLDNVNTADITASLLSFGLDTTIEEGDDEYTGEDNDDSSLPSDVNWGDVLDDINDDDIETLLDEAEQLEDEAEEDEETAEQRYQQELADGEISGKADDLTETDREIDARLDSFVRNIMSNIMTVYANIYMPLFLNPPKGVLYKNENTNQYDIMCVGKSGDKTGVKVHGIPSLSLFAGYMYGAILSQCDLREAPKVGEAGMEIKAAWMNRDGTMKYNYAPHIQVRNCMGVYRDSDGHLKRAKTWDEFSKKLKADLHGTIMALLKRADISNPSILKIASESIQELYTTIVLVNEFDIDKAFRLTIYNTSASIKGTTSGIADSIIKVNPLSKPLDQYEVLNNSEVGGVREILIVTDKKKYKGEINFAYKTLGKILQAGGTIDLKHAVVGTDLKGKSFEVNLANKSYTSIAIMAGSGSGKGVLTLSLMSYMLAAKCPVVYLDYKPDMAGTMWNLERKYGVPVLAVDGLNHQLDDAIPVRNYNPGYGIPQALREELTPELGALAYAKGVQLMNLLGGARLSGMMPSKRRIFFILDEAEQCGGALEISKNNIKAMMDANKPKGKNPQPSPEYIYLKKLYGLYSSIGKSADEFLKTNGRSGNMGAITIGQSAYINAWKGPFKSMATQSPVKFLGVGSDKGGAGIDKKVEGYSMLGMGYFGFVNGGDSSKDNTTMIKTTLVLNDADYDASTNTLGKFTGSIVANTSDDDIAKSIVEDDYTVSENNEIALAAGFPLGSSNPLVGFPGLIEYIGKSSGNFDLKEAISAGYREVEKLLNLLGIVGENAPYKNVDAYMYSAKEDSLFSYAQFRGALQAKMTIYDYISNGGADDSEEMIEENGESVVEDNEVIHIGASEKQTGNSENSSVETLEEDEPILRPGQTAQQTQQTPTKLLTTSKLMNGGFDVNFLTNYYEKILKNKLYRNDFAYNDRAVGSPNGLSTAAIYLSNMYYVAAVKGAADYTEYIEHLNNQIAMNNDPQKHCALAYEYLNALDNSELSFDQVPTQDMMRVWLQKYMSQTSIPNPFNQQTTGTGGYGVNPNDTFGQDIFDDQQSTNGNNQYNEPVQNVTQTFNTDVPPVIMTGNSDNPVNIDLNNMIPPVSTGVPIQPDELRSLSPLRTEVLMRKNYSMEILLGYYTKFWLARARANRFNYQDREHPGEGLKGACLCWGNLTYLKHVLGNQIDDYVALLSDKIRMGQDSDNNSKYALGIIHDYRNGGLNIDNMPSEQRLNEYVDMFKGLEPQPQQQQTYQQQYQQYQQQYNPYQGMPNQDNRYTQAFNNMDEQARYNATNPDMYENIYQSSFNTDPNGNIHINQPRDSQNVAILDQSAFMIVKDCSSRLWKRFEKKLFESKNGTSFELNQRWISIIQMMETSLGRNSIYHVQIVDNSMLANKKIIRYENLIQTKGYHDGLGLYDIVNFKTMFKRLPMIQTLTIDGELLAKLAGEYGTDLNTLYNVFRQNTNLKKIAIVQADGNILTLDRSNLNATKAQLQQTMDETVAREQLEHLFARKNPNLYAKGPGYLRRVTGGIGTNIKSEVGHGIKATNNFGRSVTKKSFNSTKELSSKAYKAMFDDKDPRIRKALKYSIGAGFFGAVGLVSGAGYFLTSVLRGGRK